GITSRPYRGRPACNDCGFDGGFGCPIGAKGAPAVTALRDAMTLKDASNAPLVTLRAESTALRLRGAPGTSGKWRITTVDYLDEDGAPQDATADIFVLAASPIESARLAIRSELDLDGRGNSSGLLGRNLMFHYQTLAFGVFADPLHPHRGRAITHMLDDFAGPSELRDALLWPFPRGGTLELGGTQNLIDEAKNYQRGPHHRTLMRVSPLRERIGALTMQGEDLPQEGNGVDLDPELVDVHGLPAPRITYRSHSFELAASAFYLPRMLDVLRGAGAVFVAPLGGDMPKGVLPPELEQGVGSSGAVAAVPGSRHIMGVFRMGDDPQTSVTDRDGKFHDLENLYSGDGAVFPTSGGMNPSLTIMALSYRMACAAIGEAAGIHDPARVLRRIDSQFFQRGD
ncbi:MAG: GMC oxidoreductase, partial [Candidatus Binatia bacterium]